MTTFTFAVTWWLTDEILMTYHVFDSDSVLSKHYHTIEGLILKSTEIVLLASCQQMRAFVRTVPVSIVFMFYVHYSSRWIGIFSSLIFTVSPFVSLFFGLWSHMGEGLDPTKRVWYKKKAYAVNAKDTTTNSPWSNLY